MQTIIIDQPLATLIVYGLEQNVPPLFKDMLKSEEEVIVASSSKKPTPGSILPKIKDKYVFYRKAIGLPDYDKLPINKFVGYVKVNNGKIESSCVLPNPVALPKDVMPYRNMFDLDINSNRSIKSMLNNPNPIKNDNGVIESAKKEWEKVLEEKELAKKPQRPDIRLSYGERPTIQPNSEPNTQDSISTTEKNTNVPPEDNTKTIAAVIGMIVFLVIIAIIITKDVNIFIYIGAFIWLLFYIIGYFRK